MLRADDTRSEMTERLLIAIDRGIDTLGVFRGLGKYLMPQLRVTGLAVPITPLVQGNGELANRLYRNRFTLAGAEVSGGTGSIFAAIAPSEAWASELHGFAWLTHLAAGGLEMHRAFARTVIADWFERRRGHPGLARRTLIRATRLKTAVVCAPFLLSGAPQSFRGHFFRMMAHDASALSITSPRAGERLPVAIALAYAALSLEGLEGLRTTAFQRLEAELSSSILADGGHVSRNPAVLLELLVDLLPLRTSLAAARQTLPRIFGAAIERMLPMLRFFAHGDDGLAAFQGVLGPMTREFRCVLGQDSTLGRPLSHAPHSGYARLAQASALVIADIGNDALCQGPLAFEFSDSTGRIIVNCGLPGAAAGKWFAAACRTVAHSTATLVDEDAPAGNRLLDRWLRPSPRMPKPRCTGRVTQSEHGLLLRAINHAFAGQPGDVHERDIFLSASGNDLRGEDRFQDENNAVATRFHLHPAVKATVSKDGQSVMLILANKSGWRFSARGGQVTLEESVYLFGAASPRNTQQIVIRGTRQINWALKRIEKRNPKTRNDSDSPELPL